MSVGFQRMSLQVVLTSNGVERTLDEEVWFALEAGVDADVDVGPVRMWNWLVNRKACWMRRQIACGSDEVDWRALDRLVP